MFHQERNPALKVSIKEILENFDSFTHSYKVLSGLVRAGNTLK
jgi:hypothetical protein